jgi:cysteine desulfurase / selenocysteine lyase
MSSQSGSTGLLEPGGAAPGAPGPSFEDLRREVTGLRCKVPVLGGAHVRYVFLDNAASTPTLKPILSQVNDFLQWYSSVHRGTGFKSLLATRVFDRTREVVLEFLGGDPAHDTVIFGRNTTDAINKLARRFPFQPGDMVLTTEMEHHSNDLPWRKAAHVIYAHVDQRGALVVDDIAARLREHAGRIKLVAITGAANVTGYLNPIHRIARMAHEAGAEILVDVAQMAPHRTVDMRPHGDPEHLDYVALSAHKMYAPLGTGALVGRAELFRHGDPDVVGGGVVDLVTETEVQWTRVPEREEAGSPNVVGAVALAAAIRMLQRVGMDRVAAHEAELTRYTLQQLLRIRGIEIYGDPDPGSAERRLGVISFNVKGMSHALVAAILGVEGGVGVRHGCFCAHPYLKRILHLPEEEARRFERQVVEGDRSQLPGAVRLSFGIYNNLEDVNRFLRVLRTIARRKWKGRYSMDPVHGEFTCEGYEPEFDTYFRV